MKRWIFVLPVLGFGLLAFFLFRSLWAPPPDVIPSALIDKPAPLTDLPALDAAAKGWSHADLTAGHVTVINVFSSTCVPCRLEAPELMQLAQMPGIHLYGFVWKDTAAGARSFLDALGDPFSRIGFDGDGRAGLDWGIRGWPETFVVDGHGVIRFKYDIGPLTPQVVQEQLLPAIKAAQGS